MLYRKIADCLQDISKAPRDRKIEIATLLLNDIDSEMLCPVVRLILGELWPPWEEREMRIGPESLMVALKEISKEYIDSVRDGQMEMGAVAEVALQKKSQHPLSSNPLQAISVYEKMRRISSISGDGSEHRKNVILRGLFLDASPLEGKFIARTALRNMQAGMGHKTILSALCQAFNYKSQEIQRAYNLMPDPGSIAYASMHRKLQEITIRPTQPIKPMFIRPGKAIIPGAFLPKYPGLRVQVHEVKKEIFVFTSRLRNITKALDSLSLLIAEGYGDFIIDADLIGLQEGRICSQAEMVKYINRRRLSRKSNISPVLMAYDLMYQGSKDLTGQAYKERHKRLLDVLGEPKLMPFIGISPAEERVFHEKEPLDDYLRMVQNAGGKGLMGRNLEAAYFPGSFSDQDFIIKLA